MPQTQMWYDAISTGATVVSLIGTGAEPYYSPIDGKYSVLLQGIVPGSTTSISQTGYILSGIQSLLFEAQPGSGPMNISIGGQNIPFTTIGTGANYTLYGADISAWANQTEQLSFSALGGTYNNWEIDDISFSTSTVPESNIGVLTAIGGLLFGARKWFARR